MSDGSPSAMPMNGSNISYSDGADFRDVLAFFGRAFSGRTLTAVPLGIFAFGSRWMTPFLTWPRYVMCRMIIRAPDEREEKTAWSDECSRCYWAAGCALTW